MKCIAFEKSVGGVIFRKKEKNPLFLLLQYRSRQWDFAKGHGEGKETEIETLKREVFEETGINDISISEDFRLTVRYFYRAKGNEKQERLKSGRGIYIFKTVVYYIVETTIEEVRLDFENGDYGWFSFGQAFKKLGNDDSRRVLEKAIKAISGRKKV